jgi:hypothetical protein
MGLFTKHNDTPATHSSTHGNQTQYAPPVGSAAHDSLSGNGAHTGELNTYHQQQQAYNGQPDTTQYQDPSLHQQNASSSGGITGLLHKERPAEHQAGTMHNETYQSPTRELSHAKVRLSSSLSDGTGSHSLGTHTAGTHTGGGGILGDLKAEGQRLEAELRAYVSTLKRVMSCLTQLSQTRTTQA